MTLSLPHEFDSTAAVKLILRGVAGLLLVVVLPGILYSVVISGSRASAAQLLLIGILAALSGWVVAQNLRGSAGTITAQADVLIARTDSGAGVVVARELASTLGLSYQEEHALR